MNDSYFDLLNITIINKYLYFTTNIQSLIKINLLVDIKKQLIAYQLIKLIDYWSYKIFSATQQK